MSKHTESQYFCVDCKHYQSDDSTCARTAKLSLVSGTTRFSLCTNERGWNTLDSCGEIGKFFIPVQRPLYSFDDQDDLSNIPFGR